MADIKIDGKLFQERIGHFVNAWKADKRAGDTVFNGASSIVILMGKLAEDAPEFHKNNAVHVSPPYQPCAIAKTCASTLNIDNYGLQFSSGSSVTSSPRPSCF